MAHTVELSGNGSATEFTHAPLVLRSAADVEKLLIRSVNSKRLPRGNVVVALPDFDVPTRERFQSRLNKSIAACGCAAGGVAFLVSACLVTAGSIFVGIDFTIWSLLRTAAIGLPIILFSIAIAKLLSLRLARYRFDRDCRRIIDLDQEFFPT